MQKKSKILKSLSFAVISVVLAQNAFAEPSTRFILMDKDENNSLNLEEFMEANSNMSEMAFDLIDSNKDKEISSDEWNSFMQRHSSPEGFVEESKSSTMPAQDGAIPTKSPTMPSMNQMKEMAQPNNVVKPQVNTVEGLPILAAPKVETPTVSEPSAPKIDPPKAPTVEKMDDLPVLTPPKN